MDFEDFTTWGIHSIFPSSTLTPPLHLATTIKPSIPPFDPTYIMMTTFLHTIESCNIIILTYHIDALSDTQVYPERGTIAFGSGFHACIQHVFPRPYLHF